MLVKMAEGLEMLAGVAEDDAEEEQDLVEDPVE